MLAGDHCLNILERNKAALRWPPWFTDYLSFTRKERVGVLALVCLIVLIFLLPTAVKNKSGNQFQKADTAWISSVRMLETGDSENGSSKPGGSQQEDNNHAYAFDRTANHSPPPATVFYFDPNTIDGEGWKKLGLRPGTIRTIQNYLSKGGRFRKPEDLEKIYGLFPDEYARIAPYVRIEATSRPGNKVSVEPEVSNESRQDRSLNSQYAIVDINSADTADLIALPGIGSKLAARIIHFRDRLGGFYSLTQVGETFGLQDSVFQKIKAFLRLENSVVRKININTAALDELKAHPYIRYNIANAILSYRKEHGAFSKPEDLKKVMVITDEVYNKIIPYVAL